MNLSDLKRPDLKTKRKRVGRGPGSNKGKTSGRGQKGAKSRSGYRENPGFQGADINFIRKLPKRGMSKGSKQNMMRHSKKRFIPINVEDLNIFKDGTDVTKEELVNKRFIKKAHYRVKILGTGELKRNLNVHADAFSKSAIEKIKQAGGTHKVIEVTNV